MQSQTIQALAQQILNLIQKAVPFLIGLAVVYFFAGIVRYIAKGGNEKKESSAKDMIIYGIIGIFVMVSVWGLLQIITVTFFGTTTTSTSSTSIQQLLTPITNQQIGTGQTQP